MSLLDKVERLNSLFDQYSVLLTEKQKDTFIAYYHEDFSLQEIAEANKVSRNAIHDQLKKVEIHLENYEQKLSLLKKVHLRNELLQNFLNTNDLKYLLELKEIDDL